MLASLLRYRRAALRLFRCVDEWVDKVTRTVAAIRSRHLFAAASQTEVVQLTRTSHIAHYSCIHSCSTIPLIQQSDGKSDESGKDGAEAESAPDLTYTQAAELATEFDGLVERVVAAGHAIVDLQVCYPVKYDRIRVHLIVIWLNNQEAGRSCVVLVLVLHTEYVLCKLEFVT